MSTLAQDLIESNWRSRDDTAMGAMEMLAARLSDKQRNFDVDSAIRAHNERRIMKHIPILDEEEMEALALARESLLTRRAERFIFTEDAPAVVRDLVRMKALDASLVAKTSRLPAPVVWVEWRGEVNGLRAYKAGALIDSTIPVHLSSPGMKYLCIVAIGEGGKSAPAFVLHLPELPVPSENEWGGVVKWTLGGDLTIDEAYEEAAIVMQEILSCLFLICTPRVCEVRDVVQPRKLQAAREKRGKPPLIGYKQLTLNIGVGTPRYASGGGGGGGIGTGEGHHKRLHQVIGHFRTYVKNRETPRVSWVPPHLRGDAHLGVLLHERDVKR